MAVWNPPSSFTVPGDLIPPTSLLALVLGHLSVQKEKRHQRIRWLDGITDAMNMNLGRLRKMVRDREAWRAAVHGVANS